MQNKSKYWEIAFKVIQMKFLAMQISNKKLSFDIFTVGDLQNIFMIYNVFLAIATNIPQRLKTGFVVQGHIYLFLT